MDNFENRLAENLKKEGLDVKLGLAIHNHLWKFIRHTLIWYILHNKEYDKLKIIFRGLLSITSKPNVPINKEYIRKKYNRVYSRYIRTYTEKKHNTKKLPL